ncbi:SDR family oxidoreductase [Parahaliea maris]|uniref:SDR family oxidoreductase n=1 Tax=Parahaliea maris TaxID=2716870 RepID=A0A5C8ZWI7_9GAMM|nr:SDR family oxidoreductase [Parahaliea maris]TXS91962.1 SDR family oxidoreductase [Parahaliea maris]
MLKTWLITGANRGIGLEFVRQLLQSDDRIIATARVPEQAAALNALAQAHPGRLQILPLDTGSGESIGHFAAALGGATVDVLVNNAGLYGGSWETSAAAQSVEGMDYALWEEIFRVNTIGPFRLTVALLPHLQRSDAPLVLMMSSDLGSITNNTMGQSYAYRSSKAALNMVTKGLSVELAGKGIAVVAMAPGWTRTDLGGANAHWSVADSVSHQLQVIAGLGPKDSGCFVNLLGEAVPW